MVCKEKLKGSFCSGKCGQQWVRKKMRCIWLQMGMTKSWTLNNHFSTWVASQLLRKGGLVLNTIEWNYFWSNVWVKKTETTTSSVSLLGFASFFLTQTLVFFTYKVHLFCEGQRNNEKSPPFFFDDSNFLFGDFVKF